MSQRIKARIADARRGSGAFIAIIVLLLLVGGGVWAWTKFSGKDGDKDKKDKVAPRTSLDSVKTMLGDLEKSFKAIVEDPTKADDEIAKIKVIADEDIQDLSSQVSKDSAEVKASIVALLGTELGKLDESLKKALDVPGVKEKLETLITELMGKIKKLGT